MSRVSTYLNFQGKTEEAFAFYKQVFGTEYIGGIDRMKDAPSNPNNPMSESEGNFIMNVQLPILAGHILMGTDMLDSMGQFIAGNNVSINLEPDTLEEAQRLHKELSEGGSEIMPLDKMFWGDYWSSFVDKFGTRWMINCHLES